MRAGSFSTSWTRFRISHPHSWLKQQMVQIVTLGPAGEEIWNLTGASRASFTLRALTTGEGRRSVEPEGLGLSDDAEIILPRDEDGEPIVVSSRREAFDLLVEEHHERLARLAYLLCNNIHDAEDAVAEAYARVWPKVRRGKVENVPAYLRQAVVNCVYGGHRRRAREQREAERRRVDWRDGISFEREAEDAAVVRAALLTLAPKHRTVVVLRFFDDLSEDDTAAVLDLPVGTVKSRCSRALSQLRHLLGPAFEPTDDDEITPVRPHDAGRP